MINCGNLARSTRPVEFFYYALAALCGQLFAKLRIVQEPGYRASQCFWILWRYQKPGVANHFLAPAIGALLQQHPKITIEIVASIGYADLTRSEADIALRGMRPAAGDLIAVRLGTSASTVVASRERAAELSPHTPLAATNLAGLLLQNKDPAGAVEVLDQTLRAHPDAPLALFNRGVGLAQLGRSAEARGDLLRALELLPAGDPNRAQVEQNLKLLGD